MTFGYEEKDATASLVETKTETGRSITGVEFSLNGEISLQNAEHSLDLRHSFELSFDAAEELLENLSSAISQAKKLNAENGVPIVNNVTGSKILTDFLMPLCNKTDSDKSNYLDKIEVVFFNLLIDSEEKKHSELTRSERAMLRSTILYLADSSPYTDDVMGLAEVYMKRHFIEPMKRAEAKNDIRSR